MKFEIDKHREQAVKCLVMDIYAGLKHFEHFKKRGREWEIKYTPVFTQVIKFEDRVKLHEKSIARGDIFSPIVVIDGNIIDGRHKAQAIANLGYKLMPVAVAGRRGESEVVLDKVYKPLVGEIDSKGCSAGLDECGDIYCINCTKKMTQKRVRLICDCGNMAVYEEVLGWTAVNGEDAS